MTTSEEHILRHSAFSYLSQWHQTDSALMAAIVLESNSEKRGDAFRKLAIKYQVIRTFPIKKLRDFEGDVGLAKRWRKVAASARKIRINPADTEATAAKVQAFASRLGDIFATKDDLKDYPNLISAATKFLWFAGHTSIKIYDSRAVAALNELHKSGLVNGNYAAYAKAWDAEFKTREPMVAAAIAGSVDHIDWSVLPDGPAKALALRASKKVWFRDRVFDKFLWTYGAKKEKGAISSSEKVAQLKELIARLAR